MSQSRLHDILFLLAGGLLAAGCTDREPSDSGDATAGVDPEQQDALVDALAICKPFARKTTACFAEQEQASEESSTSYGYDYGYGYNYVTQVGYCVAQVGYGVSDSPACGQAFEDYFACLGALDCDDIFGGDDASYGDDGGSDGAGETGEPEPAEPCEAESDKLETACEFDDGRVSEPSPGSDSG